MRISAYVAAHREGLKKTGARLAASGYDYRKKRPVAMSRTDVYRRKTSFDELFELTGLISSNSSYP